MAKVLVVGAGAVGAPIAAWLASAGHRVSVLARGPAAAALESGGITWYLAEDPTERSVAQVEVLRELRAGDRPDLVLLAVKSGALDSAAASIARTYGRELVVVGLQNGVEVLRILPAHFRRPLLGVVHFNAWIDEGRVHGVSSRGPLVLAPLGLAGVTELSLAETILARGVDVVRAERARDAALGKMALLLASSLQVLTAFHRNPPDEPLVLHGLLASMLAEGVEVVRAAGADEVKVPGSPAWLVLRAAPLLPKRLARPLFDRNLQKLRVGSLAQDLERGVDLDATELDAIHGELVRLADDHGLEARILRTVFTELRERFRERPHRPMTVSELARRLGPRGP